MIGSRSRCVTEIQRLRAVLGLFFLALAIPAAILVRQAHRQLQWESFHQYNVLAEELATRIDDHLRQLVDGEEARSLSDYAFLVVAGDPTANFVQRSVLSDFPVHSPIPGLLGYFQIDPNGQFSTPLLPPPTEEPATYGISDEEFERRIALQAQLRDVLSQNPMAAARYSSSEPDWALGAGAGMGDPAIAEHRPAPAIPSALPEPDTDESSSGPGPLAQQSVGAEPPPGETGLRRLHQRLSTERPSPPVPANSLPIRRPPFEKRAARRERSILLELQSRRLHQARSVPTPPPHVQVTIFESEIDPFEFYRNDASHFVLFRRVWRDGARTIQGALIDLEGFLTGLIEPEFRLTAVSRMSVLSVAHRGKVLAEFSGGDARPRPSLGDAWGGELLYRTRLSPPMSDLELIFTIQRLPAGPGSTMIGWLAGILSVVLCVGFYLMYRLGLRQIDVNRQQQDFVSAVSHELKTPLTSIRMYGEMLREGWVPEERRTRYYDFIFTESERLSRLISNVLQLARLTRGVLEVDLRPQSGAELLDAARARVATQIELAGFEVSARCDPDASRALVRIDADCFAQIAINLVDNALKFGAKANPRRVELHCGLHGGQTLVFSVRDYGPGVPRDRTRTIFRLFYRLENELTRETVGTGIGLALVDQLARAMNARVEVVNREPGAEFQLLLDTLPQDPPGTAGDIDPPAA